MPAVSNLMMSVSGIRGIVGEGLTPDRVTRFAAAFGTLVGRGTVILGRDSRLSGDVVCDAVSAGLRSVGCDVALVGIVPTPTVQLAVEAEGAKGGIVVTASHNPPEWNALKFVSSAGTFLQKADAERLFAIERDNRMAWVRYDALGAVTASEGAIEAHVARILALPAVDVKAIRAAGLRVVVDALHGAAGPITARLMNALGVEATILYEAPTGRFPRGAEPVPANIGELCERVRAEGAAVGFALDPDGDRLALVDDTGHPMTEDMTLPLAIDYVLRGTPGSVVANYSTSLWVDVVAERHGAAVHRAPVGEANVVEIMQKTNAIVGGEGNGGVILPAVHLGRDAPVAMALILALLAAEGRPISSLAADLPRYVMKKEKFALEGGSPAKPLGDVSTLFGDGAVDRTDGVYIRWADGFLHVRKSGTEPIVRVIGESADEDVLDRRIDRVRAFIQTGH